MAASSEDKDYCHQLEKMIKKHNDKSSVTPLNIVCWERNLDVNLDTLLFDAIEDKDMVIIRIGENVTDREKFTSSIVDLVKYCQDHNKKTYITGCFWQDDDKELAIINAASFCKISYIPLYWISELYSDKVYPKEGDLLYDIDGKTYNIHEDFVLAHPNDYGMKLIAETIYKNL